MDFIIEICHAFAEHGEGLLNVIGAAAIGAGLLALLRVILKAIRS